MDLADRNSSPARQRIESPSHPATILIVEDEKLISWSIANALRKLGYVTVTAETGEEGLRQLSNVRFDLIITDMTLPVMNGLQFVAAARRASLRTPIIMISARDHLNSKEPAFHASVDCFIDKPFKLDDITERVREFLAREQQAGT